MTGRAISAERSTMWKSVAACGLLPVVWLAGCGANNFSGVGPPPPVAPPAVPYSGPTFTVRVMAGKTPLVASSVQFYTAGTTGNGSSGTALLSAAVATDTTGTALVPANYTCPSSTGMTYLVATGGTLLNGGAGNSSKVMLAAVGACSSVAAGTAYVVNEVTTVAGMYALAPFYAGGSIGASSTNLLGLSNAFATAATLANVTTGSSAGTALPANGVTAASRVNSIANALNACLVQPANCTALYAQAPSGTPANTLEAVYDLAKYPTKNVQPVYAQSQLSTAYTPVLDFAPSDWTVFLTYSGAGLSSPGQVAVDSTGDVWVASYFYAASKFTPTGAAVQPNGVTGYGLNNSFGLAIDGRDNVWVANEQPNTGAGTGSMTELNSSGAPLSGAAGYIAGGLNYPISVAIDANGTTWVVDYGDSTLTLLNPSGVPVSGAAGYTTPLFAFPVVVAIDGNHNGWIGNQADATVTRVSPDGAKFTNFSCCGGASGIAIDQGNNVWIANFYANSISMISNAGVVVGNGTYTGSGSVNHPQGIAVDGAGTVFVANYRAGYLSELSGANSPVPGSSLTPATGLGADAGLLEAFSLAIDASGNVWVSNQGNNTLTKFVGLAAPVKTPILGVAKIP